MAAHTGARRSEMIRAERQDVDFEAGIITIREKKRVRGKVTTRRVPMSSRLKEALAALSARKWTAVRQSVRAGRPESVHEGGGQAHERGEER